MAASWGCFDLQRQEFLYEALKHAGVDTSYLPEVRKGHFLIGKTRDGVPVIIRRACLALSGILRIPFF